MHDHNLGHRAKHLLTEVPNSYENKSSQQSLHTLIILRQRRQEINEDRSHLAVPGTWRRSTTCMATRQKKWLTRCFHILIKVLRKKLKGKKVRYYVSFLLQRSRQRKSTLRLFLPRWSGSQMPSAIDLGSPDKRFLPVKMCDNRSLEWWVSE